MAGEYPRARFTFSAASGKDLPRSQGNEFCVFGRSNVGKSTFINHLFNDRTLARVSKTPGKTTLANFYALSNGLWWVDLPGYGYTKLSRSEDQRLSALVHDYCTERTALRGILWLVDMRHPELETDRVARDWLVTLGRPILLVLTKSDKVSSGEALKLERRHRDFCGMTHAVVRYSSLQNASRQKFWQVFGAWAAGVCAERRNGE